MRDELPAAAMEDMDIYESKARRHNERLFFESKLLTFKPKELKFLICFIDFVKLLPFWLSYVNGK